LYEPGEGYDVCICVHAEQNALLTAARFGIPGRGRRRLHDARAVFRMHEGTAPGEGLDALIARFRSQKGRVKKLMVPGIDPNLGRSGPETIEDTGQTMPAA
jgi:hypothetical protein